MQGLLSSYADYEEGNKRVFLFNAYLLYSGISLLVLAVLLVFPSSIFSLFTKGQSPNFYFIFTLYLFFNLPTYLLENFFLIRDQAGKIYLFGFFSFFSYLLALMLPIWMGWSFFYSILGLAITALIKHIYLIYFVIKNAVLRLDISLLKSWIFLSSPLIIYAFLGGLMQTFDGWIINYWYDGNPAKFAIFRYGAKELPLVIAMTAAFSSAMLPEIRKDLEPALIAIKGKSLQLFHILFPLSIILIAFSNQWFPLVFTKAFSESIVIFDTYLIIITSRLIFSRTVLVGLQDNRMVLFISIAELILNIGLSIWLINLYGLLGVAFATFLAFSVEKILLCLYLWKRHGIGLNTYLNIPWWLAYSTVLLMLYFGKNLEYFS